MSLERYKPAKLFTIEEANSRLPLVRAIVGDIVGLARELLERRARLAEVRDSRFGGSSDVYKDEIVEVERQLEKDSERLGEYVSELLSLGVELKSLTEGLVDFPALLDGKLVYLCWKYDEPEVLFWHELDAGFAGRKSLTADSAAGTTPEDDLLEA